MSQEVLKRGRVALAGILLLIGVGSASGQVDSFWTNDAPGIFDWSDATNWSTDPLFPNEGNGGNTFNAFIQASTNAYTAQLSEDIDLVNFTLTTTSGSVDLAGFTLTLDGQLTHQNALLSGGGSGRLEVAGSAGLSNATAAALADITFSDQLTLQDSTFMGVGSVQVLGSLEFDSTTCDDVCDTNFAFTGGSGLWHGTGDIRLGGTSSFSVGSTSTFDIQGDNRLFWDNTGSQSVFTNDGVITRSSGAGETFFEDVDFENNGTLRVQSGTFRANQVVTLNNRLQSGTWEIVNGSTLDFDGTSLVQNRTTVLLQGAGAQFIGLETITRNTAAGTITLSDGVDFEISGNFDNRGTIEVTNGSEFRIAPGQNFDSITGGMWANGTLYLQDGTFRFDGADVQILNAEVHLDGDDAAVLDENDQDGFRNLDRIASNGKFELSNRTGFQTGGDFTVNQGGSLVVNDGVVFRVAPGSTLTNFDGSIPGDTLLEDGRFDITGELIFDGATVNRLRTDFILDGPDATIIDELGDSAFEDLNRIEAGGKLTLRNGNQLMLSDDLVIDPGGELNIENPMARGAISMLTITNDAFQDGGDVLFSNSVISLGGTYFFNAGQISGTGTVIGDFVGNGSLRPGEPVGTFTVDGDYYLGSSGSIEFDIRGVADHDLVAISGMLTAEDLPSGVGTIDIVRTPSYFPQVGDSITIMTFGDFDAASLDALNYTGLNLPGGKFFEPVVTGTPGGAGTLTLVVAPAPGTGAALVTLAALRLRRRRATAA